jgi:hypothetical protein
MVKMKGNSIGTLTKVKKVLIDKVKQIYVTYDKSLVSSYQRELKRDYQRQEDLFFLLCCSELLGIPNPASYYMLELYPYMFRDFHEWHLRQGMKKSPLSSIRCC